MKSQIIVVIETNEETDFLSVSTTRRINNKGTDLHKRVVESINAKIEKTIENASDWEVVV